MSPSHHPSVQFKNLNLRTTQTLLVFPSVFQGKNIASVIYLGMISCTLIYFEIVCVTYMAATGLTLQRKPVDIFIQHN